MLVEPVDRVAHVNALGKLDAGVLLFHGVGRQDRE